MKVAFFVCRFQCAGDLPSVVEGGFERQRALQSLTGDQFHAHRAIFQAVDLHNIGVQRRVQASFRDESAK